MSRKPMVLVIDDDREIVRGMSIRLRAAGFEVSTAWDGKAGVASAIDDPPDAIILDLQMPVMDGFEALGKLQETPRTSWIPVIVVSANAVERVKHRVLDAGARVFLEKPFDSRKLIAVVEWAVEESQTNGVESFALVGERQD